MQLMAGCSVASRNGERRSSLRPLVSCLLLGAAGCGADASDVAQGSGALEPQATEAGASDDDGLSRGAEHDEARASAAGSSEAPAEGSGTPFVLPSDSPITEPPDPAPLPTTELQTTRPVNSSEPVDVIIPPGECRFEYLGKSVRCEDPVRPHVIATDAADLFSCMRECLQRDDCTAVTDYLYLDGPEGCLLHVASCDEPERVDGDEDDGGHEFRRVCDGD
jgi:hypothetical protein